MKHLLLISLLVAFLITLPGFSGELELTPGQEWENELGIRFVWIPPGEFMMGSPENEEGKDDETRHHVILKKAFWLGKYEVTQGQWQEIMGTNPSRFDACGKDCPVDQVSWEDVQNFIQKLNQRDPVNSYRLPTEAEWEYAARAGSDMAYCFGNDEGTLAEYAWYVDNSGMQTHPVGQKRPNRWGLYDMHGNEWEWIADWYGEYLHGSVTNPVGPSTGSYRVMRGGGWRAVSKACRSANRHGNLPSARYPGFRLLRTPR